MISYHPDNQGQNDIASLEESFFRDIFDKTQKNRVYDELHSFFASASLSDITAYKNTYWKWYVFATWRVLNYLPFENVVEACRTQIPTAVALGIDVYEDLMKYLMVKPFYLDEAQTMYSKIKKAFFESGFIIGKMKNKDITTKNLISEIEKLDREGNDALLLAELRVQIKGLLFPEGKSLSQYAQVNPEEEAGDFIDLVHFFLGIDEDKILNILDVYRDPLSYTEEEIEEGTTSSADLVVGKEEGQPSQRTSTPEKPVKPESVQKTAPPAQEKKMSLPEIKQMIDQRFKKDPSGQIENIEGVLQLLDQLAGEQGNEKIRELYYFDEEAGEFRWNETLI